MTAITKNLPWFIREPAVSLIGDRCYTSLVEELHVGDVECLKYAISKGLGLGIVVGGSIMKVPQILIILKARSARGLSLPAYVLETLSYAITLSYSARNGFPFSTYGENFFLTLQNALITILVVYYPSTPLRRKEATILPSVLTLLATLGVSFVLSVIPKSTLSVLQVATLPLSVFSKLPQITANHRARSTGNLSAFAVGSQIAGCLARLFTTITEVGDPILFLGFAIALALNCVLGVQMWLYWNADAELKEDVAMGNLPAVGEKEKTWARSGQVDIVVPPVSPAATSQRFSSPSGRRWSRKVD